MKNPYDVIKSRYVTEKATVLEGLKESESSASLKRCKAPKYLFLVHPGANKPEIKCAIEEIYKEQKVKVTGVNTITVKPKAKRRGKGRLGASAGFKKAIVTFEEGDVLEKA